MIQRFILKSCVTACWKSNPKTVFDIRFSYSSRTEHPNTIRLRNSTSIVVSIDHSLSLVVLYEKIRVENCKERVDYDYDPDHDSCQSEKVCEQLDNDHQDKDDVVQDEYRLAEA